MAEQSNNKSTTRYITINNETKPFMVWCKEFNLDHVKLNSRLDYGWTPEEVFELVPRIKK